MASPQRKPEPEARQEANMNKAGQNESLYYQGMRVTSPDKRDGLGKTLLHVLIAAAIFGTGLYLYWGKVQRDEMVHAIALEARSEYLRDNVQNLVRSKGQLEEALEIQKRHRYSIATIGLISSYLWYDHGIDEYRPVAEQFLKQAEDRTIEYQERYGALGLLMLGQGQAEQARTMLVEDVIDKGGTGPAILGSLALALRQEGNQAEARRALQRAGELERRTPRYPYWIAQMYFDGEQYGNAIGFINAALDINPVHTNTLVLRSRLQIANSGNLDQAVETLNEIIESSDRRVGTRPRALAHVGLAEHHYINERYTEAIASADNALSIRPNLFEAFLVKGMAMVRGELEGSMEMVLRALEAYPFSIRAYHETALALARAERFDDARRILDAWGDNLTRTGEYHLAYGLIMLMANETEVAKQNLETAISMTRRLPEAHYELGRLALANEELGDERLTTAAQYFENAIRYRSNYPEAHEQMGFILLKQATNGQEYQVGLQRFARAIEQYKGQNVDHALLEELRERVGAELLRLRQRGMRNFWMRQSLPLIQ